MPPGSKYAVPAAMTLVQPREGLTKSRILMCLLGACWGSRWSGAIVLLFGRINWHARAFSPAPADAHALPGLCEPSPADKD